MGPDAILRGSRRRSPRAAMPTVSAQPRHMSGGQAALGPSTADVPVGRRGSPRRRTRRRRALHARISAPFLREPRRVVPGPASFASRCPSSFRVEHVRRGNRSTDVPDHPFVCGPRLRLSSERATAVTPAPELRAIRHVPVSGGEPDPVAMQLLAATSLTQWGSVGRPTDVARCCAHPAKRSVADGRHPA